MIESREQRPERDLSASPLDPVDAVLGVPDPFFEGGPEEGAGEGGEEEEEVSEDLLLRFQLGEGEAFEAIVLRYQGSLTRFFYRLCWDLDRAEDFVQDVFLKLIRGANRYQPRGKLSTFLFRIATNRWIDYYRSRRPRPKLRSLNQGDPDEEQPLLTRLAAESGDPCEGLQKEDEQAVLREALNRLSLPHRLVFELAVYQGLPYADISEMLEIPEGTVKSRMHNTVKALKKLVAEMKREPEASSPLFGRQRRA
ncbi:MAG: RNA polymerase sigma factor [Planctomycetota bacterium]